MHLHISGSSGQQWAFAWGFVLSLLMKLLPLLLLSGSHPG
jgi:hypothetical protein